MHLDRRGCRKGHYRRVERGLVAEGGGEGLGEGGVKEDEEEAMSL